MKRYIYMKSDDGFKVAIDSETIKAVGIEPPGKVRIFVISGEREYASTRQPRQQFKRIMRSLGHRTKVIGMAR